ncbi:MAG: PHP domain-containing protein [Clostridium perfringens]|nr:PHP domain-containing protein [Clostridium perfringens]
MYKKGDFHIHSIASDGNLDSLGIIKLAKEKGLDIISITDHNTMDSVHEAIKFGKKYGVCVIPGVEISSMYNGDHVHILCYFKEDIVNNKLFYEILNLIKRKEIKDIRMFLNSNLDRKKDKFLTPEEIITLVDRFNGICVLAHPVRLKRKTFDIIKDFNFKGIEAKYVENKKEDEEFFLNFAKEKGIIYTAGSDFHTFRKKYNSLGEVTLNKEEIKKFLDIFFR